MPHIHFRSSHVLGFAALALVAASSLVSCKTTESGGDYASNYPTDGGFNPYPGQGAIAEPGTLLPGPVSAPLSQYAEAPPPPPPGYEQPTSAPKYTAPTSRVAAVSSVKKPSSSSASSSTTAAKKSTPPKKPVAKKKPTGSTYAVVKGDTLSAIARKKGTTVAKIKAANGLTSDFLSIGKKLKIP